MNQLRLVEAEMDKELALLFKMAQGKPKSVTKLKEEQSAWVRYRDAHVKAYWPSEEAGAYGSVHPMCIAMIMTRLTHARVLELREMTSRVEGDVCSCYWPD